MSRIERTAGARTEIAPQYSARSDHKRFGAFAIFTGGGTAGNEQLTAMAGALLFVLFAVLGLSILRIRQLISVHLFVGLLLMGPVALKMTSTGYRFARYYGGNPQYKSKGPPVLGLRLIAPIVVISTVVVFASGVVLLFAGPANDGQWLLVHKASFILWIAFTALHVLGHLPEMPSALRAARAERAAIRGLPRGESGRWIALAGALAGGVLLAALLIPQFAQWTSSASFPHFHH